MKRSILLIFLALCSVLNAQVKVDFKKPVGIVKPVNGVGQPPMIGFNNTKLFKYLKEAGIPYSRLHDVGGAYGANVFVDIPNVFRNFDADENDPASYDFAFTDVLIKGLVDNGVEPYYRLGVTIENYHNTKAYRIYPPSDYAKWARVCEHVIRHYTEGWADGFQYKISHWEIWNEPDNGPTNEENSMWYGDWNSYMELYGTVAPYLKSKFPHLKIGGYGSCGFYAITGEGVKAANCSPRNAYFVDCFLAFLEKARAEKWPLDFFSAHSYDKPYRASMQMEYCRKKLDEYGFKDTELSVNEWLPSPGIKRLNTIEQAADIATEMILFQNGSVDDAEMYDARARGGSYGPLFHPETHELRKAYYSFVLFNELRKLGTAVKTESSIEGVAACAAVDDKGNAAMMITNITKESVPLNVKFGKYKITETLILDNEHNAEPVIYPDSIAPATVLLVKLSK